jgi:biotin carboxylase
MRRVLAIGCGFPQLSLLRALRSRGCYVVGADANPRAPGVALASELAVVSTADPAALVALARASRCDAVATTGSELALRSAAAVAHELALPFYADPVTVRRCQDKDEMRAAYRAAGLVVPAFAPAESAAEAHAFAASEGFPLVVKPSRGWGQRAVARVDEPSELTPAVEAALAYSASQGLRVAVVERFLVGPEYSVNGWVERGELVAYCVTERVTLPGKAPLGVMVSEVAPSGLDPAREALVVAEAARGARALGLDRGPCYSQVVLTEAGPVLFETAARCGGGFDADVTRLVSGVDFYDRLVGVALGDAALELAPPALPAAPAAAVRFLVATPGVVQAVEGLDEARGLPHTHEADVFVREGDTVQPLTDGAKRAGYVLVTGASRSEAIARSLEAASRIHVKVAPLTPANPEGPHSHEAR